MGSIADLANESKEVIKKRKKDRKRQTGGTLSMLVSGALADSEFDFTDDATLGPVLKETGKSMARHGLQTVRGGLEQYEVPESTMRVPIDNTGQPVPVQTTAKTPDTIGEYASNIWNNIKRATGIGEYEEPKPFYHPDQQFTTVPTPGVKPSAEEDKKYRKVVEAAIDSDWLKANPKVIEDMGFVDQLVMAAPNMGVAAALTVLTKSPAAGATYMGTQIMGSSIEENVAKGVPLRRATKMGFINAIAQYPLEQFGLGKATKLFNLRSAVARRLQEMAKAAAAEGTTEALQVLPERITNILAQDVSKSELEAIWDTLTDPETLQQMGLEGAAGAIFGGVIGAGGAIKNMTLKQAAQAVLNKRAAEVAEEIDFGTPDSSLSVEEQAKLDDKAELDAKIAKLREKQKAKTTGSLQPFSAKVEQPKSFMQMADEAQRRGDAEPIGSSKIHDVIASEEEAVQLMQQIQEATARLQELENAKKAPKQTKPKRVKEAVADEAEQAAAEQFEKEETVPETPPETTEELTNDEKLDLAAQEVLKNPGEWEADIVAAAKERLGVSEEAVEKKLVEQEQKSEKDQQLDQAAQFVLDNRDQFTEEEIEVALDRLGKTPYKHETPKKAQRKSAKAPAWKDRDKLYIRDENGNETELDIAPLPKGPSNATNDQIKSWRATVTQALKDNPTAEIYFKNKKGGIYYLEDAQEDLNTKIAAKKKKQAAAFNLEEQQKAKTEADKEEAERQAEEDAKLKAEIAAVPEWTKEDAKQLARIKTRIKNAAIRATRSQPSRFKDVQQEINLAAMKYIREGKDPLKFNANAPATNAIKTMRGFTNRRKVDEAAQINEERTAANQQGVTQEFGEVNEVTDITDVKAPAADDTRVTADESTRVQNVSDYIDKIEGMAEEGNLTQDVNMNDPVKSAKRLEEGIDENKYKGRKLTLAMRIHKELTGTYVNPNAIFNTKKHPEHMQEATVKMLEDNERLRKQTEETRRAEAEWMKSRPKPMTKAERAAVKARTGQEARGTGFKSTERRTREGQMASQVGEKGLGDTTGAQWSEPAIARDRQKFTDMRKAKAFEKRAKADKKKHNVKLETFTHDRVYKSGKKKGEKTGKTYNTYHVTWEKSTVAEESKIKGLRAKYYKKGKAAGKGRPRVPVDEAIETIDKDRRKIDAIIKKAELQREIKAANSVVSMKTLLQMRARREAALQKEKDLKALLTADGPRNLVSKPVIDPVFARYTIDDNGELVPVDKTVMKKVSEVPKSKPKRFGDFLVVEAYGGHVVTDLDGKNIKGATNGKPYKTIKGAIKRANQETVKNRKGKAKRPAKKKSRPGFKEILKSNKGEVVIRQGTKLAEEPVAVQYKGNIYTGYLHGAIKDEIAERNGITFEEVHEDSTDGFVTDKGEFLTRKEAAEVAKQQRVLDPVSSEAELEKFGLDSVDIDYTKLEESPESTIRWVNDKEAREMMQYGSFSQIPTLYEVERGTSSRGEIVRMPKGNYRIFKRKPSVSSIVQNERGGMDMTIPGREGILSLDKYTSGVDALTNWLVRTRPITWLANTSTVDTLLNATVEKYGLTPELDNIQHGYEIGKHQMQVTATRLKKAIEDIDSTFETATQTVFGTPKVSKKYDALAGLSGKKLEARKKALDIRKRQIAEGGVTSFPDKYKALDVANKEFTKLEKELRGRGILADHQFAEMTRKNRAALIGVDPKAKGYSKSIRGIEEKMKLVNKRKEPKPKKIKALAKLEADRIKAIKRLQIHYKNSGKNYLTHIKDEISRTDMISKRVKLDQMVKKFTKRRRSFRTAYDKNTGVVKVRRVKPQKLQETGTLVMKGLRQEAHDMHLFDMFKNIADQQKDWRKRGDDTPWVAKEGDIRIDPKTINMKVKVGKHKETGKKYKLIPKRQEGFGELSGQWVYQPIYNALKDDFYDSSDLYKKWKKIFSTWKAGKTVWNPATTVRNVGSNFALSQFLGDVNWMKKENWKNLKDSIIEYKDTKNNKVVQGKYAKEIVEQTTIYQSDFATAEIGKDGADLIEQMIYKLGEKSPMEALGETVKKYSNLGPWFYGMMEVSMKSVVYKNARQQGMSIKDAEKKAHYALFDYSKVPPALQWARNWYSPFITFSYKAFPRVGKQMVRKPWKLAPYLAAIYMIEEAAQRMFGEDDEEREWQKRVLPGYIRRDSLPFVMASHVRVPFKTPDGRDKYLDLSFYLPWGGATDMSEGMLNWMPSSVAPNNPLFNIYGSLKSNHDMFWNEEIVLDADTAMEQGVKIFETIWNEVAPAALDFRRIDKIRNAVFARRNRMGVQKYSVADAVVDYLFGMKFRNIDYFEEEMWRGNEYDKKASALQEKYARKLEDTMILDTNNPFNKSQDEIMDDYMDEIEDLMDDYHNDFMRKEGSND